MQVARRGGDVGVTHQSLDDVDVLAAAVKVRGIGVAPAAREPTARVWFVGSTMIASAPRRCRPASSTSGSSLVDSLELERSAAKWTDLHLKVWRALDAIPPLVNRSEGVLSE